MDQCPVQGESKTLILLTLQKPEVSAISMGHLVRKGFSYLLRQEGSLNLFFSCKHISEIKRKIIYIDQNKNEITCTCNSLYFHFHIGQHHRPPLNYTPANSTAYSFTGVPSMSLDVQRRRAMRRCLSTIPLKIEKKI